MEASFLGVIMQYVGFTIVYLYYNYIKKEKVTWRQIEEEKDNYGMSKYGILAGSIGLIVTIGFIIVLVKLTVPWL